MVAPLEHVPYASIGFPPMGILDDAIREHIELKRKHGAAEDELQPPGGRGAWAGTP